MYLAVCTIQRDNAKKLREWIIYHSLVGVSKFYYLAHMCQDNTREVILRLQEEGYDIEYLEHNDNENWYPVQITFYNYVYRNYNQLHKWIAFIDDDEFLVPAQDETLTDILARYEDKPISALGVYWTCYGSSGNLFEPNGLIIENYKHRMNFNHSLYSNSYDKPNKHIKSIVKCGEEGIQCYPGNMHIFQTKFGTYDELMRPFDLDPPFFFYDYNREPSHTYIRINHYIIQSFEHYLLKKSKLRKKVFGNNFALNNHSTDAEKIYWKDFDVNDVYDNIMDRYIPLVREKI